MAHAIVLAGAPNTGPLAELQPVSNEALVEVGGRPMIQWVVEALDQAASVGEILVVGPEAELGPWVPDTVSFVEPRGSLLDNIRAGLENIDRSQRILICTSDIPLISGEMIDRLLEMCEEIDADFYYPVVRREVAERAFPNANRTYVPIRDGTFTGGNVFVVEPGKVMQSLGLAEQFLNARKSPLKLALALGPMFILKFVLKTLTVAELEEKVSKLAGIRARAIFSPDAEIGFDIDKPVHYELVERTIQSLHK